MNFIFFAWFASIVYAIEVLVGKFTAKYQVKNIWLYNFFWSLFIVIFTATICIYKGAGLPKEIPVIATTTILYVCAGIFYLLSLYGLDISILSPLTNIRIVFTVLIAGIFLKEILSTEQYILIGILILAGIFLTLDEKLSFKSFFKKPILFAFLTMVCLSLESVFIKKSIALNGYWETNLWTNIFGIVLLLPTYFLFKKDLKSLTSKKIGTLGVIAATGTIATLAANKAYGENVSITSAILIIPFSMIFVIILSFFKPHFLESHSYKVYVIRAIAAIVMIISALKLSGN